jgi:selenocysteine-specific elongation factor
MRHIIIGTAGHVDHGKTALIKALTDIDCDTHKEEKERGITINLGFAHIDLPTGDSLGIIDVPGHKDFVKTMISGAFGMDMFLLVIAADSGIMPQTKEHLQIIELLGVKKGIVVLTKKDLVDEEMLELAQLEVEDYLDKTSLKGTPVLPVSSVTGDGIQELVAKIVDLIPQIEEKSKNSLFRMFIDRVFDVKGVGYIVTGSVLGGKLGTGDNVYLLPGKTKPLKVKQIQRHGTPVDSVEGGDRAAVNLAGFKMEDYHRGVVLSEKIIEPVTMIDAVLELFNHSREIGVWTQAVFYAGTFETIARIHLLDKDVLKEGEKGIVQIHLEEPAILMNKDRFILRNSANDLTLGGGTIIDVQPLHHKRRTPKLLQSLNDMVDAVINSDKLCNVIKLELKKSKQPLSADQLAEILSVSVEEILQECSGQNDDKVKVFEVQDRKILVSKEVYNQFIQTILEELQQYHQRYFLLEEGLEAAGFYGKFGKVDEVGKLFIQALLDTLEKQGGLRKAGKTYVLSEHRVQLDDKSMQQLSWLEKLMKSYDKQTPLMKEVEAEALSKKINKEHLKMLLKYLVKEGKLRITEREYIHSDIVEEVKIKLLPVLTERERGINEKEFRLLFDSTKNFVKTMIRILVDEGLITKSEFYIHITDKGKDQSQPV